MEMSVRRTSVSALAVAALAVAGCMKLEQEVTLKEDGSSEVSLHYAVSEKAPEQLAAMKGPGMAGGAGMPFDPQAFAKQMEGLQKGTSGAAGPTPVPQKSPRDEVEEMKKAARTDPALKPPEKPKPEPGVEDYRKQIEEMKKQAAKNPDLKPEPVERPAPPGKEPAGVAPAGLTIKEVRSESKDGWQHTYVTATCRSLASLGSMAGGTAAPREITLVKNSDGNYVLTIGGSSLGKSLPADLGDAGDDAPAAQNAQLQAMMKPLLAGFRMSITYHLPGKVLETNAHTTKGSTVSWVLDGESADFMKKAGKLSKEGMRVVFRGKGLDLSEIRPPAPAGGAKSDPEPK
jgi:hypothetical protein